MIAAQLNPGPAGGLECAPIGHAAGIVLQCAHDHAWLKLRVLSDDVFADADLKRSTQFVRSKEAKEIKRGELVDALRRGDRVAD
jgi:hypothetical protein